MKTGDLSLENIKNPVYSLKSVDFRKGIFSIFEIGERGFSKGKDGSIAVVYKLWINIKHNYITCKN
jgi:hypothetical protein